MEPISFFEKLAVLDLEKTYICGLNSNGLAYPAGAFPTVLAAGAKQILKKDNNDKHTFFFEQLEKNKNKHLFGYLGYDLKNEIEDLSSQNPNNKGFYDAFFFEPEQMYRFDDVQGNICRPSDIDASKKTIIPKISPKNSTTSTTHLPIHSDRKLIFQSNFTRTEYIQKVVDIQSLIKEGIVYELNFCMEFVAGGNLTNPVATYKDLCVYAPAPFSVFLKLDGLYMLGASPERFLQISAGGQMLSQPIKGTAPRHPDCVLKDLTSRYLLKHSDKEKAENLMITDLVRNDLARSAKAGSVQVSELCSLHGFSHVWQMISTIKARLEPPKTYLDALRAAFPMGSMTGMPKISAMKHIEQLEKSKRGIFSGATGYIDPKGNMDFNVNIRSLFYNQKTQKICFQAGSAITIDSDPEKEFEECLLKAAHLVNLLGAEMVF